MKTLILDINAIFHRGRNAILRGNPENELSYDGQITTGTYSSIKSILYFFEEYGPFNRVIGCYDKGGNNRKKIDPNYKANRRPLSENHLSDFSNFLNFLPSIGVNLVGKEGIEADDLIAAFSKFINQEALIISVDKDMLSLITDCCNVMLYSSDKKRKLWTPEVFKSEYGFPPSDFPLYKAIVGDKSDNIKGLYRYGKVRAKKLLENSDYNVDNMKAFLSPEDFEKVKHNLSLVNFWNDLKVPQLTPLMEFNPDKERFLDLCETFGFNSLKNKL